MTIKLTPHHQPSFSALRLDNTYTRKDMIFNRFKNERETNLPKRSIVPRLEVPHTIMIQWIKKKIVYESWKVACCIWNATLNEHSWIMIQTSMMSPSSTESSFGPRAIKLLLILTTTRPSLSSGPAETASKRKWKKLPGIIIVKNKNEEENSNYKRLNGM